LIVTLQTPLFTLQTNTMTLAFVTPKSNKAKNRFANLMDKHPECIVEQIKGNRAFLRSKNGKNFFWVDVNNNDEWGVLFEKMVCHK